MNVLRSLLIVLVAVLAACVLAVFLFRVAVLPRIMAEDATGPVLAWRTLIPETALVAYAALDRAPDDADALQIAETSTEPALDGQTVSIAGFMVPLDATRGTTAHFLLVPYQGACIHTPAPPPNQVISVYAEGGARLFHNWQPVTVTGVISVANEATSLADAGYVMALDRVRAYREEAGATALTFVQAEGAHDSPLLQ